MHVLSLKSYHEKQKYVYFLATQHTPEKPTSQNCKCGITRDTNRKFAEFNRIIGGTPINPVRTIYIT